MAAKDTGNGTAAEPAAVPRVIPMPAGFLDSFGELTLPATWADRAVVLEHYECALATAKAATANAYATEFLTHAGTDQQRNQAAKLATSVLAEMIGRIEARLSAYRLLLEVERDRERRQP